MSEIKFACPHCSQHIACDDLYCGEKIDCPGCERELFIPSRSAFIPLPSNGLTVRLPVAYKERHYPRSAAIGGLTGEEDGPDEVQSAPGQHFNALPLWLLLLLPFAVAFVLLTHRGAAQVIGFSFILCALAAGFYLAKVQHKSGAGMFLLGVLYAIAAIVVYGIMAIGLLFVGCLVALSHG